MAAKLLVAGGGRRQQHKMEREGENRLTSCGHPYLLDVDPPFHRLISIAPNNAQSLGNVDKCRAELRRISVAHHHHQFAQSAAQ